MHELPITESILEISLRHAAKADAKRIVSVHLVIGQLASIVDDSVQFYWDIITENTIAQGAKLHFKRIPVRMYCSTCAEEYAPDPDAFECPKCGGIRNKIISGEEFYLSAIDIEKQATVENGVKNG